MKKPLKTFAAYQSTSKEVFKKNPEAQVLFKSVHNGQRRVAKIRRTEDTARDITWVDTLWDAIPHLQKIVDNPKSFIKSTEYLVPAELAKKTGPESVTHLATHSQYVKKIDKDGSVIPSKILTTEGEIDVQIYENRFIMSLLKRLHLYIERRYVYLKHYASLTDSDVLYLDNSFKIGDQEIKYTSTITVSTPAEASRKIRVELDNSLNKVEKMRQYIAYFLNSDFMKKDMKGARPLVPPIMMTNMLKSNPDYHNAYELWLFLNREEHVSMEFLVNEDIKALTKSEQQRIDFINYLMTLDLLNISDMKPAILTKKEYSAEMLSNADDILYLNDKFAPASLIRTDEKYYEDLTKPIKARIANKSPKTIDNAFKEEKAALAKIAREKKAALALQRRRDAEAKALEKKLEKIRKQDELNRLKLEEAEAKRLAQSTLGELDLLRKNVKETAISDKKELISSEEAPKERESSSALEAFKKNNAPKKKERPAPKKRRTALSQVVSDAEEPKKKVLLPDEEAQEAKKGETK